MLVGSSLQLAYLWDKNKAWNEAMYNGATGRQGPLSGIVVGERSFTRPSQCTAAPRMSDAAAMGWGYPDVPVLDTPLAVWRMPYLKGASATEQHLPSIANHA